MKWRFKIGNFTIGNFEPKRDPENYTYSTGELDNLQPVTRSVSFDGEKTPYELGDVLNVLPNYQSLRLRSYEAKLKSDVVRIISQRLFKWVIGTGLKLQAEPSIRVLQQEKLINNNLEGFHENIEARFNLWAKSKLSDYLGKETLHDQAKSLLETTFFGGDALVVTRIEEGKLSIQIIDGQQIQTPYFNDKFQNEAKERGNTISKGIEKNERGKHVAFYVRVQSKDNILGDFERVPAFGEKTGRKMAWMVYFEKHRIDHDRGIGALAAILEKVEKLDRYTEATVGSAEERAKLAYFFEHGNNSTEENPLANKLRVGLNRNKEGEEHAPVDSYAQGEEKAQKVAQSTGKMAFNLPKDVKVSMPSSGSTEQDYPEFAKAVFNYISAALEIPPEVAMQLYNSNYSASRAAINAFQFLLDVTRDKLTEDFYKPIYELYLEVEVMKSKINAPGYLKAITKQNEFALKAYSNSRFLGKNMPHIDPVKEVKAIREMLGDSLSSVPLINLEQATEKLNSGEWNENYKKLKQEQTQLPKEDGANKTED